MESGEPVLLICTEGAAGPNFRPAALVLVRSRAAEYGWMFDEAFRVDAGFHHSPTAALASRSLQLSVHTRGGDRGLGGVNAGGQVPFSILTFVLWVLNGIY